MTCSICGQSEHNRKNCPNKNEQRDRAMIVRIDNMTPSEQAKMERGITTLKKRNTSDEARATIVSGRSRELPGEVQKTIGYQKNVGDES